MKVNLNSRCTFVLTDAGAFIWNARYINLPAQHWPEPVPAGTSVTTMLWEVMQVFGPHTFLGMGGPHFVDNNLEITPC